RVERLERRERLLRRSEHRPSPVELRSLRLDLAEEEAGEAGIVGELRDLLLHERRGARGELRIPVVAVLAEPEDEPVRELVRCELAEVDAVHPVELRVVELGRARADALEREALDQLVLPHERRIYVGRPAEQ